VRLSLSTIAKEAPTDDGSTPILCQG